MRSQTSSGHAAPLPRHAEQRGAAAARTGTPGGVNGTRARAITRADEATTRERRSRISASTSPRKNVGKTASRPQPFGVAEQVAGVRADDGAEHPGDVLRRAWCRTAASGRTCRRRCWPAPTTRRPPSAPEAPRLTGPPGRDGASAMPMARNRPFIRVAAAIAAASVPPLDDHGQGRELGGAGEHQGRGRDRLEGGEAGLAGDDAEGHRQHEADGRRRGYRAARPGRTTPSPDAG